MNPSHKVNRLIVIPLYDHVTNCHMTIPCSIMYINLCTDNTPYVKTCINIIYVYCKNDAVDMSS